MTTELVVVGGLLFGSLVWLVFEVQRTRDRIRVTALRRVAIADARQDEESFISAIVDAEKSELDDLERQVAEWR